MSKKIKQLFVRKKRIVLVIFMLFIWSLDFLYFMRNFDKESELEMIDYFIRIIYLIFFFRVLKKEVNSKKVSEKITLSQEEIKVAAFHEAGHTVVNLFLNARAIKEVSIKSCENYSGYVSFENNHNKTYSMKELQEEVTVLMGGFAAEKLFCGSTTVGVRSDLKKASEIVIDMLGSFGMDLEIGLVSIQARNFGLIKSEEYCSRVTERANELLLESEKQATRLLERHRSLVEQIAKDLIEKETIKGDDLKKIFSAYINKV